MSMPTFPKNDPPLSREGSLNEIIASIAAEELSLSHILNTEGERLQYVLGTLPGLDKAASLDEVLRINQSVKDTLSGLMEQQMMLSAKLSAALKAPTIPGPAGPAGPAGGRDTGALDIGLGVHPLQHNPYGLLHRVHGPGEAHHSQEDEREGPGGPDPHTLSGVRGDELLYRQLSHAHP